MDSLPVDHRGFVVPWFVAWFDGEPDHRVVDTPKIAKAVRDKLCWLCGQKLGDALAFVIGPMCTVNRISSEPPSHLDCARYAVRVCPFISKPRAKRRRNDDMEDWTVKPGGDMLEHNPGAQAIWLTRRFKLLFDMNSPPLFELGAPSQVLWFCEGRAATHAEVVEAMERGLPHLASVARREGPDAVADLRKRLAAAINYLPQPDRQTGAHQHGPSIPEAED